MCLYALSLQEISVWLVIIIFFINELKLGDEFQVKFIPSLFQY